MPSPLGGASRRFASTRTAHFGRHTATRSWRRRRRRPRSRRPSTRHGQGGQHRKRAAATPPQHHRHHNRRLEPVRDHSRRARCGSPRTSTWTGTSPTRGRTNTVYPQSLDTRELLQRVGSRPRVQGGARISQQARLSGDTRQEGDDGPPADLPDQAPSASRPEARPRKVYELVVRRFLATFSTPMSLRVDAHRHRGRKPASTSFVAPVSDRSRLHHRQPARRTRRRSRSSKSQRRSSSSRAIHGWSRRGPPVLSQGKLVDKSRRRAQRQIRADIIQKLVTAAVPTGSPRSIRSPGIANVPRKSGICHNYVPPRMATPEMTAELKSDIKRSRPARTLQGRGGAADQSRENVSAGTTTELEEKKEDLAKQNLDGMDEEQFPWAPARVYEEAGHKQEDGSPNRLRIIEPRAASGCTAARAGSATTRSRPIPARGGPSFQDAARPVAARGAVLDLLSRHTHGQGLPRPSLEALPQRQLPVNLRDPPEARGGEHRSQRSRSGGPTTTVTTTSGKAGTATITADRTPQAGPQQIGEVGTGRVRHARGDRPLGEDDPGGGRASDALGPETLPARSPGARRPVSGLATCLKDAELELDARAELLLFCAARAGPSTPSAHFRHGVICDRFAGPQPIRDAFAPSGVLGAEGLKALLVLPGGHAPAPHRPRPARSRAAGGGSPVARTGQNQFRGRGHRVPANRRRPMTS